MKVNDLNGQIIGAAIEVHIALGPGLLESAYERCLCRELDIRKIPYNRKKEIPVASNEQSESVVKKDQHEIH
jgi:GxxExxY protein